MNVRIAIRSLAFFLLSLFALSATVMATDAAPAAGTSTGTCAKGGEAAVKLAYAGAFVDQKDDAKPTLLILSDIKLPIDTWQSEFDLMRDLDKNAFSGVIFFIDKDGANFRTDFYWHGRQSSVSGYFKLTLDKQEAGDFAGSVKSNADGDANDPKVDAVFHAAVKK